MCTEPKSSKDLLYSEYMNTNVVERVIESAEKNKSKPVMKYVKSSVLDRVRKTLSEIETSQKENVNIEDLEGCERFIEMDVAVLCNENVPEKNAVICNENVPEKNAVICNENVLEKNAVICDENVPEKSAVIYNENVP